MNKKLSLLLTAGTLAMLSACGDSVVETDANPPINKLTVFVRDTITGKPLEGANVELLSTGETAVTAANGAIIFSTVYTGQEATVLVQKTGYASIKKSDDINGNSDNGNYVTHENTFPIYLYPKTASVDGYLFYKTKEDASKQKPAIGAKVELQLAGSDFLDRIYTAEVDANGKYAFSELPAVGTQYSLVGLAWNLDGVAFGGVNICSPCASGALKPGVPAHIAAAPAYDIDGLFKVKDYNLRIGPTTPIVFTFSDEINLADLSKRSASVPSTRAANFAWTATTLTVTPVNEWQAGSFDVTITAESVKGTQLTGGPYAITVVTPDTDLSNVTMGVPTFIAKTSDYDSLKWDKPANATVTSYEVWYKTSSEKYYSLYTTCTVNASTSLINGCSSNVPYKEDALTATAVTIGLYRNWDELYTGKYHFIVRAINNYSQTAFSALREITIP
jgi:5-hydroxyisourate hydrolase-like protein (transthyretin family)